jgi:elongation factor P
MAMLDYNEILPGTFIVLDGDPYEVIDAHVFRKQQRKPVNSTKLRNVKSGKVVERTFQAADNAEEADLSKQKVVFIYEQKGAWWFHEEGNPGGRFSLPHDVLGAGGKYLKAKDVVDALVFDEEVIGIKIPIKVELKVTEAAPAVRGNTAQNATKVVTLETGATVTVPLFINEGDILRINTETGSYVERVEKGQ